MHLLIKPKQVLSSFKGTSNMAAAAAALHGSSPVFEDLFIPSSLPLNFLILDSD